MAKSTPPPQEDQLRPKYVFTMVHTDKLRLYQINATKHDTATFANDLREAHRRLRGFLRHYFSINVFSYCDFAKFEKFCPSSFSHRGSSLPPNTNPQAREYYYHPPPAVCLPPISPEEFRHIYYHYARPTSTLTVNSQAVPFAVVAQGPTWMPRFFCDVPRLFVKLKEGNMPPDTMPKIPQRFRYFDEAGVVREELWGLLVREERSALMVCVYVLVALSPWFVFFFCVPLWLGWRGD